jgi:hypothetical protein
MTTLVQQRTERDCFFCCVCMLANADYEEGWELLREGLREQFEKGGGLYGDDCEKLLEDFGFNRVQSGARTGQPTEEPGDYYVLYMQPVWATMGFVRNMLWGRTALIQVRSKNYQDEHHIVYWNGRALFDPSTKLTFQWHEVEPIHVWLFDEYSKVMR